MKKLFFNAFLLALGALLPACETDNTMEPEGAAEASGAAGLIIRSGTSFGMCLGYCRTQVEISQQVISTLRAGTRTQSQHPEKTCTSPATPGEWQALVQVVDREALRGLPETIGCPDCADAGAEWIEIEEGDQKYRVTFGQGADVPAIQPLLDRVREVRDRYARQCE